MSRSSTASWLPGGTQVDRAGLATIRWGAAARRARTRALGVASTVALAASLAGCSPAGPDIVVVTLDTLRRDHVGAYGDARGLTPNLDRLAESALVHESAYTTMPTTGPAHLSLFTGLYPSELDATRNGEALSEHHAAREVASILAARGYATAAFVTSHLAGRETTGLRGFQIYDQPRGVLRSGDDAVGAALSWLSVEDRRPIFLWVHLYDSHAPYGDIDEKRRSLPLDPKIYGWIDPADFASGETAERLDGLYEAGVREADRQLGRLLAGVRELLGAPPIVIVAADHGESLAERVATRGYAYDHGEFLDPETVQIPLLVSGPGIAPGRSRGAASIRDLYTTVLEASGVGDAKAASEGRRDLRTPSADPRIVGIERRSFSQRQPADVEAHRGGASDGILIVVADGDGVAASGDERASAALIEAASERAREATLAARRAKLEFAPGTLKALKSLGYVP